MSAKIWYTPPGASDAVEIDLGIPLSAVEDYPVLDEAEVEAFSGLRRKVIFTTSRYVDVTIELIADNSVVAQLEGLLSHLRRDGLCSIAENGSDTFGAFLTSYPTLTSSTIRWGKQLWEDYSSTYSPSAGDLLVMCGPAPKLMWAEVVVFSSGSSSSAVLTAAPVDYWATEPWIFVRSKGFWPILRLRSGASPQLIDHGNRVVWSLVLPLEVPPNAYDMLASEPSVGFHPTNDPLSTDVRTHQAGEVPGAPDGWSPDLVGYNPWIGWR